MWGNKWWTDWRRLFRKIVNHQWASRRQGQVSRCPRFSMCFSFQLLQWPGDTGLNDINVTNATGSSVFAWNGFPGNEKLIASFSEEHHARGCGLGQVSLGSWSGTNQTHWVLFGAALFSGRCTSNGGPSSAFWLGDSSVGCQYRRFTEGHAILYVQCMFYTYTILVSLHLFECCWEDDVKTNFKKLKEYKASDSILWQTQGMEILANGWASNIIQQPPANRLGKSFLPAAFMSTIYLHAGG